MVLENVVRMVAHVQGEEMRFKYKITGGAPTHKKGRKAERIVADLLTRRGFNAELNDSIHGPDIVVVIGQQRLTVEVKAAVQYIRHGKYKFWLTEKVTTKRKSDDAIAIVSPDGRVLLDVMGYHLKMCRKDGRRNVTQFVKGVA